ncbi:MAG: V-type ATP synthase subunit E [Spirochaetes bacterium]|nr:V-type ATP synthase subunit E [Spirochaetota bacterium]
MDIQLKELIETIKKDGIASAEAKAAQIIAEAERQAEGIREKAQREAERILQEAKREIARTEQASRDALVQAGRDLLLGLERRIVQLFEGVLRTATQEAIKEEGLVQILTALVTAWVEKNTPEVEVLLSPKDYQKLEKGLQARLAKELKKGVVIKPSPSVESGFRVGEKDGSAYYDFTAEGLAEILAASLSPRLAELLKQAAKTEG